MEDLDGATGRDVFVNKPTEVRQKAHFTQNPCGLETIGGGKWRKEFFRIQRRERKYDEDNQCRERNKVQEGTDLWHSGKAGQTYYGKQRTDKEV